MTRFKNSFLMAIGVILVTSCEPSISFTDPQPINTKNIFEFPKRVQGRYSNIDMTSNLEIGSNYIKRIDDYDSETPYKDLDSNLVIEGNTIIDKEAGEKYTFNRIGDTIIIHHHEVNIFFEFDSDHVVRKMKGYYFLNTHLPSGVWEVKKLNFGQKEVSLCSISNEFDFEVLKEVTNTPKEQAMPYQFSPTTKQFRKFVRKNGFRECEIYSKRKNKIK